MHVSLKTRRLDKKLFFKTKEELVSGDDLYWDEYNVQFSKKRFEIVAKLYCDVQRIRSKT